MTSSSSQAFKKIIFKAHELLVTDNSPESAIDLLKTYIENNEKDNVAINHWLGLCYLENENYDKAKEAYLTIRGFYQAGFCELLKGNHKEAVLLWDKCTDSEVRYWSQCLKTICMGKIDIEPTFLNIRNHLEADFGYLLRSGQEQFVNNILKLVDYFVNINLETYKFIGRALLHNGFENSSVGYLLKGQKLLPNDPEIYYHLGQYSQQAGAYKEALSMYKHCLLISPTYSPANDRLKEMKRNNQIIH
ncbi:MAG: tetratricopeptide repeat protein [Vampirovibrionia bacterium]